MNCVNTRRLEEFPEGKLARDTLAEKLRMDELQLRRLEVEIESKPFDSLDFVELGMALEEAFHVQIPLRAVQVDLAGYRD
jgi:acyl carrier protein